MKATTTKPKRRPRTKAKAPSDTLVRLTHPEKVLYPEPGITKRMLADYYVAIADWIFPHLVDRPLTLVRCPEGEGKTCFYQKNLSPGMPREIDSVRIRQGDKTLNYAVVRDLAGLLGLVQLGALEIHIWGCRDDRIENPDRMVFDLDPDVSVEWSTVVTAARELKEFLKELGLVSFLKTTGGKGLHLVVPLERKHTWDEVKRCSKAIADSFAAHNPAAFTTNPLKAARRGRIFLDYLRNARGATFIAPYSTRARAQAPVSTPLGWEELSVRLKSDRFRVENLAARLRRLEHDPWESMADVKQSLSAKLQAAVATPASTGRSKRSRGRT